MCVKLLPENLNPDSSPPHSTSSYTYEATTTPKLGLPLQKKGGFGPRFFGPRFKKRGPKMPNAPFFTNGAKNAKVQPRFENGALA